MRVRRPPFHFVVAAALFGALGALPIGQRVVFAGTAVADPKRVEARARFDRAMALLKEHDDAGALAEFQLAYKLVPASQTLLNIGVLSANLNRPVEAVKALDAVLADPGPLSSQQLRLARKRRDEQARKVGFLHVVTSAPATIQIDGVDVAGTPTDKPIAVAAGARLVAALGGGYLPSRKKITIAGGITSEITFDLVALPPAPSATILVPPSGTASPIGPQPTLPSGPTAGSVMTPEQPTPVGSALSGGNHTTDRDAHRDTRKKMLVAGTAIGAGGVLAVVIASAYGLEARSRNQDSKAYCTGDECQPMGKNLRDSALSDATVSTALFIAGGALLAAGLALVLRAPGPGETSASTGANVHPHLDSLAADLRTNGASLVLGVRF
jgi:hypothetical protein